MTDKLHRQHWSNYFDAEVGKESQRASAILAAAMLEQALEALLRGRLVPIPTQTDPLFDAAYAPLSSFSSKIDLCFRLGLISGPLTRDLHLIRKIRNDFAHNVTGCTFDDSAVRSRVLELVRSQRVVDTSPRIRKNWQQGPAGDFQMTVSWMLWDLWSRAERVHPLEAAPHFVPTLRADDLTAPPSQQQEVAPPELQIPPAEQ